MESTASDALGLFFAQYGPLGTFLLAAFTLVGLFAWLWLRTSRELRQDNQGKITSQASEIEKLEASRDKWRDRYYMEYAKRLGLHNEEDNEEVT